MPDSNQAAHHAVEAPASGSNDQNANAAAALLELQQRTWPADASAHLHEELLDAILQRESAEPGLEVSNVHSWHSQPDMFTWPEACIQLLVNRITDAAATVGAERLRLHMWANVMRYGGSHLAHRHGDAYWSGVYYVASGDAGAGGAITFAKGNTSQTIQPRSGQLLLLPGNLLHSVSTYTGATPRVSVAFNLFP